MIPVDNSSSFGQYEPNFIVKIIIYITRNLGTSWFSKRLIFLFRKIDLFTRNLELSLWL